MLIAVLLFFPIVVGLAYSLFLLIVLSKGIDGLFVADDACLFILRLFSFIASNKVLLSSSESVQIFVPSIISFLSF